MAGELGSYLYSGKAHVRVHIESHPSTHLPGRVNEVIDLSFHPIKTDEPSKW